MHANVVVVVVVVEGMFVDVLTTRGGTSTGMSPTFLRAKFYADHCFVS